LTALIIPSKTAQNLLRDFTQHLSSVIQKLQGRRKLLFTLLPPSEHQPLKKDRP
jgi:hypothetical protein